MTRSTQTKVKPIAQFDTWPESYSDASAEATITAVARDIARQRPDVETPFYIINLDDIRYKLRLWKELLPRIRPHYAVKCNMNVGILGVLRHHGLGFDCATRNEIDLVLSLGGSPEQIVYAHTVKSPSYLRFARHHIISRMTFDNFAELDKIKQIYPEADLILRLRVVDSDIYNISEKFGCLNEEVPALLQKAKQLSLKITGFSFHVGCQNQDPQKYRQALQLCKRAEQEAIKLGYAPKLIDIGGGFQGYRGEEGSFRKIATAIREEADTLFPLGAGYELISEPGTYMVGSALTLVCRIVGKRDFKDMTHLYVSDSVYMSFLPALYGDYYLRIQPLLSSTIYDDKSSGEGLVPTRIYGMTCDGVDVIVKKWNLPPLEVGEWLMFYNQGAYTEAIETNFNMLERPTRYYRSSDPMDVDVARKTLTSYVRDQKAVKEQSSDFNSSQSGNGI